MENFIEWYTKRVQAIHYISNDAFETIILEHYSR